MKDTAVIILNWNGADMMRRFLPEVVRSTPAEEADVIVADNGSTDNSLQVLAEEFPSVKVIVLDKNYGFAEGYNRALRQWNMNMRCFLTAMWRHPTGGSTR